MNLVSWLGRLPQLKPVSFIKCSFWTLSRWCIFISNFIWKILWLFKFISWLMRWVRCSWMLKDILIDIMMVSMSISRSEAYSQHWMQYPVSLNIVHGHIQCYRITIPPLLMKTCHTKQSLANSGIILDEYYYGLK